MVKVGDKVKFLNDVGGGIVTGFINKNTVNVEGVDGFEIPYPVSQLINVSAPEFNEAPKVQQPNQQDLENVPEPEYIEPEGEIINGKNSPDFYFCFVPQNPGNPVSEAIELFLVNDSNFSLLYRFSKFENKKNHTIKFGTLKSNAKEKLETIAATDLSDLPEYAFQLFYFKAEEEDWHEAVQKRFKVNPVKFYKESTFQKHTFFRKNALILQITPHPLNAELDKLTQDDFLKVVKEKEKQFVPKKSLQKRTEEEIVIDLHISELLDNSEGLSNREILEIQMEKVESEMKNAIQERVKRLVFIHGVGQGVLKQEVANLLKRKFKKYYFQDASFKEYGYGATMVILRR
jgi:DNA-nicking Smr family endonuclease